MNKPIKSKKTAGNKRRGVKREFHFLPAFDSLRRRFLKLLSIVVLMGVGVIALKAWAQLPAPGTLTVIPPFNGEVNLVWTPVPGATAYQISRNLFNTPTPTPMGIWTPLPTSTPNPTGTCTPIALVPASAFNVGAGTPVFQDFQVTDGRSYQYQVAGIDSTGTVGVPAATIAVPFTTPSALAVTVLNIHANALDLFWGVPLSTFPIDHYNIYRFIVSSPPTPSAIPLTAFMAASPTPIAAVTNVSYTDQTVGSVGALAAYYMLVAVDNQNNFGPFPAFSTNAAAPGPLPPVAPVLSGYIPVTPTATPTYGVQLIWNGPLPIENVTEYQILANGTPIAVVMVSPTPAATYTYLDQSIKASSQLSGGAFTAYTVLAVNGQNTPTSSNEVDQIINEPLVYSPIQVTPDATNKAVTITGINGLAGTYGLSGYRFYKSLNGLPAPLLTPITTGSPTATPSPTPFATIIATPSQTPTVVYVDRGISNANGLSYWVEPYDNLKNPGDPGVPTPSVLLLAPTPVSAVNAANPIGNNQITLSWSGANPGFYGSITNYVVYRELLPLVTPVPVATVGPSQSSYNDFVPNSTPGAGVQYQIGAVDAKGNTSTLSAVSGQISLLSTLLPPSVPQVNVVVGGVNALTFYWLFNPPTDNVTSYSVYGSNWPTLTITPTPVVTVAASSNSYSPPPDLRVNGRWNSYTYYLEANSLQGSSQPATLSAIAVPPYQVTAVMTVVATATPGFRSVQVSWNAVPSPAATPAIDSYVVYRASTPGPGNSTPIATVGIAPVPTMVYVDPTADLAPGIQYSYFVTVRSDLRGTPVAESPVSVIFTPAPQGQVLSWPNVPSGLTPTSGVTQTNLFWTANSTAENVLSYSVIKNGTPVMTVTPSPTLSINFGETPGTISSYQLIANNVSGSSDLSAPVSVLQAPSMIPVIGLTPPPGFAPTPGATPAVPQVVWISGLIYPNAVNGYNIYRATDSGFLTEQYVTSLTAPTSFVSDPGMLGDTNYYKVVATNAVTLSSAGVTANFTASAMLGINLWPNPPNLVSATAGPAAVTLLWTAPAGSSPVTAYDIFRSTYAGGPATPVPVATGVPQRANSYVDSQVTPGIPYYYSMSSMGSSLVSAATTQQGAVASLAPILSVTGGPDQAILNWVPISTTATPTPGTFSGYEIYRMTLPTPGSTVTPFTQLASVTGIATGTYTDNTVTDSNGYIYQVAPMTSGSPNLLGAFSNSASVVILPQAVLNLTAVSGDQLVQLRWTYQGTPLNSYTVERKLGTAPVSAFQVIKTGIETQDFLDTGLQDKTFYTYEVLTIDPLGLTQTSQAVNALPARPPIVNNPTVNLVQAQNGNTLSWTAANINPSNNASVFDQTTMYPLGGYHVYRSSDGGGTYQLVESQGTTSTSYTDPVALVNGNTYTYLVKAFDDPPNVNTTNLNMIHETPYNPLSAFALSASTALDRNSLRPFGAGNEQIVHIRFVVTNPGNVEIKVYSLSGTFVKELVNQYFNVGIYGISGNYPLSWDGRNMNGNVVASGVYLITTEMAGGHQEFEKIAVIK